MSKLIHRLQPPYSANLYRKGYAWQLNAAALWLQPAVMNFDVSPLSQTVMDLIMVIIEKCKICGIILQFFIFSVRRNNPWVQKP